MLAGRAHLLSIVRRCWPWPRLRPRPPHWPIPTASACLSALPAWPATHTHLPSTLALAPSPNRHTSSLQCATLGLLQSHPRLPVRPATDLGQVVRLPSSAGRLGRGRGLQGGAGGEGGGLVWGCVWFEWSLSRALRAAHQRQQHAPACFKKSLLFCALYLTGEHTRRSFSSRFLPFAALVTAAVPPGAPGRLQ